MLSKQYASLFGKPRSDLSKLSVPSGMQQKLKIQVKNMTKSTPHSVKIPVLDMKRWSRESVSKITSTTGHDSDIPSYKSARATPFDIFILVPEKAEISSTDITA